MDKPYVIMIKYDVNHDADQWPIATEDATLDEARQRVEYSVVKTVPRDVCDAKYLEDKTLLYTPTAEQRAAAIYHLTAK